MVASLSTLGLITEETDKTTFMADPMLKTMKPFLMKLNRALVTLHGTKGDLGISQGLKVDDYDADTEGLDDAKHGKKYAFHCSKDSVNFGMNWGHRRRICSKLVVEL